ncbi:unnamed protein product, partial [Prorocentrum cordatum]
PLMSPDQRVGPRPLDPPGGSHAASSSRLSATEGSAPLAAGRGGRPRGARSARSGSRAARRGGSREAQLQFLQQAVDVVRVVLAVRRSRSARSVVGCRGGALGVAARLL